LVELAVELYQNFKKVQGQFTKRR